MYEAQAQLTDAYLAASQAAEARVIAEDLVAREPWEPAHIDRFRRALVMLRVSDPDTLIAERLSGQAPFMAHDPFFDGPRSDAAAERRPRRSRRTKLRRAGSRRRAPVDDEAARGARGARRSAEPSRLRPPCEPARRRRQREIDLTSALGGLDAGAREPSAPTAGVSIEAFAEHPHGRRRATPISRRST